MNQLRNNHNIDLLVKHSDSEGVITIFRDIPEDYILYLNYPNPFSRVTIIQYAIPPAIKNSEQDNCSEYRQPPVHVEDNSAIHPSLSEQYVAVKIFNSNGEELLSLVNKKQAPGIYQVKLNAKKMPDGIYYYQLTAGDYISSKKMMLVKR